MLVRMVLTSVPFLLLSTASFAQSNLLNLRQEFFLEDPSFELPFAQRARPDKLFVSKDFETNDFNAVQRLTRSWPLNEDEAVLGQTFLRFNGTGSLASWFPLENLYRGGDGVEGGPSRGHYVSVRARQDGPFESIFGINYFDANWKLIQKNSALISGAAPGVSRGDGDLLKKYSLAVQVPYEAKFGQVWIAAPYANGTTTFDFLGVFTEIPTLDNSMFDPHANLLRNNLFAAEPDFQVTGYEFWNAVPGSEGGVKVDYLPGSETKVLLLGQPGRITNLYQVCDIEANQPYAITMIPFARTSSGVANPLPQARGWFGVDFFDSSAKKIDQVVFDMSQGESVAQVTYNPAANADFAIAWFYVEPLFRDEVIPIYYVNIQKSYPIASAVATATKTKTTSAVKATVAATKSSKRPAAAPSSPITPAIALQAKNSLLPTPAANTTSAKPAPKKTQKPTQ